MEIIDQVCSVEQSIILKDLGVAQKSLFGWIIPPDNGSLLRSFGFFEEHQLILADTVMFLGNGKNSWCAYSVSELGVMLPDDNVPYDSTNQYRPFKQYHIMNDQSNWKYHNIYIDYKQDTKVLNALTEAQARATMLIDLIKFHHITVEDVNKRLLK